jgi:hypothetical protein
VTEADEVELRPQLPLTVGTDSMVTGMVALHQAGLV